MSNRYYYASQWNMGIATDTEGNAYAAELVRSHDRDKLAKWVNDADHIGRSNSGYRELVARKRAEWIDSHAFKNDPDYPDFIDL